METTKIEQIRADGLRPQVVACIICDKKLFFVYKEKYRLWQLPQGGIEPGETTETALKREMSEELGESVASSFAGEMMLIGENKVFFPKNKINSRKLHSISGKEIGMKGKHYFFVAARTQEKSVKIDDTEFDDYLWCSYDEAMKKVDKIYQPGKKRITASVVKELKAQSLID